MLGRYIKGCLGKVGGGGSGGGSANCNVYSGRTVLVLAVARSGITQFDR